MKTLESSALQLMSHLWTKRQEATGHSWLRLNQGLRDGIFLAVRLGLMFHEDDLAEINRRFRGDYWFGSNFEEFYKCAIVYGNSSAWKAYEKYAGRKAFIWKPAKIRDILGGGGQGINNPPRLVVGADFEWKGERVTVTSFNDQKGYVVAQSYERTVAEKCSACGDQKTWPKDKILHRYTITHDDLKAEKAARAPKKATA